MKQNERQQHIDEPLKLHNILYSFLYTNSTASHQKEKRNYLKFDF